MSAPPRSMPRCTVAQATTALVLLAAALPGWASAELARAKACLGCHDVQDKRVGPPFKAIAARYAGVPGAQQHLANKIVSGGKGVWGVVVMPANPKITPAEAQQLAAWVLQQK